MKLIINRPAPHVYDAKLVLQALVTKTTTFNGTGLDIKTGTPRRGMVARVLVSNYSCTATGAVATFSIDTSSDNTTFNTHSSADPITLGTAAATKQLFIPVTTRKQYIRLSCSLSVTTGAPTLSYLGDLGISNP